MASYQILYWHDIPAQVRARGAQLTDIRHQENTQRIIEADSADGGDGQQQEQQQQQGEAGQQPA